MNRNNIIFVGGIHGVGKTTLCKEISNTLAIEYYSASELIAMLDSKRVNANKIVHDINDNQNILLDAIQLFLNTDREYLVDGHFCLIDENNSIKEVPIYTFESLGLKEIILLINDEEIILKRLKARDNKNYPLEFIQRFQQKEIRHGKYVADKIKVPIKVIDLANEGTNIEFIVKDEWVSHDTLFIMR